MLTKEEFLQKLPEKITVEGFMLKNEVSVQGKKINLAQSLKVWSHSPTGFNWGYGGSGPAQFALALLLLYVDKETARHYYQDLKFGWIAGLPRVDFIKTINLREIMTSILNKNENGKYLSYTMTMQPDAVERLFCQEFEKLQQYHFIQPAGMKKLLNSIKALNHNQTTFTYKADSVIPQRMAKYHSYVLADHVVIALEAITGTDPAMMVMYLTYLQYWCKKNAYTNIDSDTFHTRVFPLGFPREEDLRKLWCSLKVERIDEVGSNNLLDYSEAMKSIQL